MSGRLGIYSQAAGGGAPFAFGNALDFDGVNDSVAMATGIALASSRTLNFWFKLDAFGKVVFHAGSGSPYIQVNSTAINVTTTQSKSYTVPSLSLSTWYMCTVVFETTTAKVYLNGTESTSLSQGLAFVGSYTKFGGGYGGFHYNGVLDEISWYESELTPTQIANLYNAGTGNFANIDVAPLVWFKLNESGTATTAVNSGSGGSTYDGTLNNFPTSGMWVPHTPVLLLDLYPSAAHASAYFLLKSDYTGALVELRRSTDNALKDFYPDANGELSLTSEDGTGTSLATWIGANDAFERTGYDQSGNANNLQQTSTSLQTKLITGGALNVVNGKVSDDSTASQYYQFTSTLTPITTFIVNKMDAFGSANYVLWSATGVKGYALGGSAFGNKVSIYDGSVKQGVLNDLTQKISYYNYNGANFDISQNGGAETALAAGSSFSVDYLGRNTSGFSIDAQNQALVIYATDKSADKAGIQTVLNDYFTIY
jgi:hypothetical protein